MRAYSRAFDRQSPREHVLDFRERGEQMMVRDLMIGAVVLAASAGQTLAQDLAAGESSFRKCRPVMTSARRRRTKLGPELNGLDGRKAGTVENGTDGHGMRNPGLPLNH